MCKQITCRGRHPSARMDIYVMAYKTRVRNGQDRSLQSILLCAINNKTIRRAGCPHPAAKNALPIEANAANHLQGTMLASSRGTLPHCELLNQNPRLQTDPPQNQRHADPRIYRESACLFLRVYLKSQKFSLFLQTQRDFAKYPSFSLFSDTS